MKLSIAPKKTRNPSAPQCIPASLCRDAALRRPAVAPPSTLRLSLIAPGSLMPAVVEFQLLNIMKRTPRTLLVAAAMAGLLNGAVVYRAHADDTNAPAKTAPGKAAPAKVEPKLHGCAGANDCKAVGGCKSGDNGCKFKNSCKGKGGCEITKKDIKDWKKKQKEAAKPVKS